MDQNLKRLVIVAVVVAAAVIAVILWRQQAVRTSNEERSSQEFTENDNPAFERGESLDSLGKRLFAAGGSRKASKPHRFGHGIVRGVVRDIVTNESMAFIDVLFDQGTGEETVTSNGSGEFSITLGTGTYSIRALGEHAVGMPQPKITVLPDTVISVDVFLSRLTLVSGRVVNAEGVGVGGATVRVIPASLAEKSMLKSGLLVSQVPTAADGSFELELLAKESVVLEARLGNIWKHQPINSVTAGQDVDDVLIAFPRAGVISGVVVDQNGTPVVGAEVSASGGAKRQLTRTRINGIFSMEPMSAGEIVVEASAAGMAPSVPLIRNLTGEGLQVTLSLRRPEVIAGVVRDSHGAPVVGVRLRTGRHGSRMKALETYSDSSGRFEFPSVDGSSYWLSAVKSGYGETILRLRPPVLKVQVLLLDLGGIRGRVTTAGGQPVDKFVVEIVSVKERGRRQFRLSGEMERFADLHGSYELSDLNPGFYQLQIRADSMAITSLGVEVPAGNFANGDAVLSAKAN